MAAFPAEMFREALFKVIQLNKKICSSIRIRCYFVYQALLYGSGAEVGVKPASEYTFLVFVTPVGPYFKEGIKPVNMLICRDVDRAAPLGNRYL